MSKRVIMGVQVSNRGVNATRVQQLFTEYGCLIKTRLGLHAAADGRCSASGLILLELHGSQKDATALEKKLRALKGVAVRKMSFQNG